MDEAEARERWAGMVAAWLEVVEGKQGREQMRQARCALGKLRQFLCERARAGLGTGKPAALKHHRPGLTGAGEGYEALGIVTQEDVQAWVEAMMGAGRSGGYVRGMVSKVKRFYDFVKEQGEERGEREKGEEEENNPARGVRTRRERVYTQARALNEEEARELLRMVEHEESILGKRDYALLQMHLALGWKSKEILGLKWEDRTTLNSSGLQRPLEVRASEVWQEVEAFLKAAGKWGRMEAGDHLFPPLITALQQPPTGKPEEWDWGKGLTYDTLIRMVRLYAGKAGMQGVTCRTLRNTAAKLRLERGEDEAETLHFLGIRKNSSSRRYLRGLKGEQEEHWTKKEIERRKDGYIPRHKPHCRRSEGAMKNGIYAAKRKFWLSDARPGKWTWEKPLDLAWMAEMMEPEEALAFLGEEIEATWSFVFEKHPLLGDAENLRRDCRTMNLLGAMIWRAHEMRLLREKIKRQEMQKQILGRPVQPMTREDGENLEAVCGEIDAKAREEDE